MKKRFVLGAFGLAAVMLALPVQAKDDQPCGANMVCASDPTTVVAALQKAGLKAKLTVDDTGDPKIESAMSGYMFDVLFYDCVDHKQCAALQFYVSFEADPQYNEAFANRWNTDKRLLRARVTAQKGMIFDHDVSTVGGLNQRNFGDILSWFGSALNDVNKYLNGKK